MGVTIIVNTLWISPWEKVATSHRIIKIQAQRTRQNCNDGATVRQDFFLPEELSPLDEHTGYQQHYNSDHRDYCTISGTKTVKERVNAGDSGEKLTHEVIHDV